jgi:hypothetical protein
MVGRGCRITEDSLGELSLEQPGVLLDRVMVGRGSRITEDSLGVLSLEQPGVLLDRESRRAVGP